MKLISINRTWQRIYNLQSSFHPSHPIQILCDTQIHNNRRHVILSSIVKVCNLIKYLKFICLCFYFQDN